MFEDPKNEEYIGQLKERAKLAEIRRKSPSIKGDIVEEIMATGISWQNVGKKYTGNSHKEKAKISVGPQTEND
eukprot:7865699-Heterocapsa_arctica.AAC.1